MTTNASISWVNQHSAQVPNWLAPLVAEPRSTNGSFTIWSAIGRDKVRSRVLPGNVVFLHKGVAYTCPPDELSHALDDLMRTDDIPVPAVGPGKNTDRSGCAKIKANANKSDRKRSYPEPLGDPPTIEWVKVDRLNIDIAYQRSTDNLASQRLIASIAAKFDWRLCAPLVVSRRPDGTLAVIDGQHRTLAARLRADIPHLPCCIFNYSGPEEEARMFIAANRSRKSMNRLDDFYAALAAADEDALEIQRLVQDAGLSIARNTSSTAWKPGQIAFTSSIFSAIRKHGAAIASAALTNIAEAFPDQKVNNAGSIFLGLVKIFSNPPEGFDPDRLFQALLRYTAEEWGSFVTGLKGGETRACMIRDALMMAYEEVLPGEVPSDEP